MKRRVSRIGGHQEPASDPEGRTLQPLPAIMPGDFAEFSEILLNDDEFPRTFTAWKHLFDLWIEELAKEGCEARSVVVRPEGFKRFLEEYDVDLPDVVVLAAYATSLKSKKVEH